jgi:hypothetical protein
VRDERRVYLAEFVERVLQELIVRRQIAGVEESGVNRGSASTPKVVRESLQFVLRSPSDKQFSSLKREASSGFSRYSGGCSNNNNLFHH